jgi:hypothetical protein
MNRGSDKYFGKAGRKNHNLRDPFDGEVRHVVLDCRALPVEKWGHWTTKLKKIFPVEGGASQRMEMN